MALALIETIRIRNGEAPLYGLHLNRLARSCQALGVPFPRELPIPSGGEDRVRRLEVDARGVRVTERVLPSVGPVRLLTARTPHRPYPHKTTDREPFDRALAEARRAGADEAVLLTPAGLVAETALFGLFWWEEGRVAGPALDLDILPGVARARLAQVVGGLLERRVAPEALRGRPLFLANAVRGVVEVAEWDGSRVPQSPETARLAGRFWP